LEFQFPIEQNILQEKSEEIKSSTVSGITFSTLITTTAATTITETSTVERTTTATTSTTTATNSKQTTTKLSYNFVSDDDEYPFKIKESENEFLTADETRIFFEAFSRTTQTMPKTPSPSNPSQMSNRVIASSRQNGNDISPTVITKTTTVIKDVSPNVHMKTTVNDNSPNVITKTTAVVIDNSENGHFVFDDICSDDMLAVCATVGIVVVCLCTSGLYAVFYTAYQVNEVITILTIRVYFVRNYMFFLYSTFNKKVIFKPAYQVNEMIS
jgi:hypothetical protein